MSCPPKRPPEARTLLDGLARTVAELVGDLREHVFTEEREFMELLVVEVYFTRLGPEELMKHMVAKVLPHEELIARRDGEFFVEHPFLFAGYGLAPDRVAYYKAAWKSGRISPADKAALWAYFDAIIELAKAYTELEPSE